jgi:hypothetical protein
MGSSVGSGVSGLTSGSAASVVAELETRNNALRDAIAARRRQTRETPPPVVVGSPRRDDQAAVSPHRPAPAVATRRHSPRLVALDASWSAPEVFGVLRQALAADRTAADAAEAFALLDRNHDGRVGAAELGRGLRLLGLELPASQLRQVLRAADTEGDGTLDPTEFVRKLFGKPAAKTKWRPPGPTVDRHRASVGGSSHRSPRRSPHPLSAPEPEKHEKALTNDTEEAAEAADDVLAETLNAEAAEAAWNAHHHRAGSGDGVEAGLRAEVRELKAELRRQQHELAAARRGNSELVELNRRCTLSQSAVSRRRSDACAGGGGCRLKVELVQRAPPCSAGREHTAAAAGEVREEADGSLWMQLLPPGGAPALGRAALEGTATAGQIGVGGLSVRQTQLATVSGGVRYSPDFAQAGVTMAAAYSPPASPSDSPAALALGRASHRPPAGVRPFTAPAAPSGNSGDPHACPRPPRRPPPPPPPAATGGGG